MAFVSLQGVDFCSLRPSRTNRRLQLPDEKHVDATCCICLKIKKCIKPTMFDTQSVATLKTNNKQLTHQSQLPHHEPHIPHACPFDCPACWGTTSERTRMYQKLRLRITYLR